MAADNGTTTQQDINWSLDVEMIRNFDNSVSALSDILGVFSPEAQRAGVALYMKKISGANSDAKGTDASSGTAYVEGDEVALSEYKVEPVEVGTVAVQPYRKRTTAQAILKSGYQAAVLDTDRKMLSNTRNSIMAKFFGFLGNGTGGATGTKLQAAIANADAALETSLETNGDDTDRVIHFISRADAAEYLGTAPITTQNAFGMTYLENFLGVTDVFLSSKVPAGTLYATAVENIHLYGLDFSELAMGGLSYTVSDSGLIGVAHVPAYDHVSCETNVLCGCLLFPEVTDYIVKGTIAPSA